MSQLDKSANGKSGPELAGVRVDELAEHAEKAPGTPGVGRMVGHRHRDRDFTLRRILLIADLLGVSLALAFAMSVSGSRSALLEDAFWVLPTLPGWAFLFWTYRLYGRAIRRFEPTHVDDMPSLFHAVVIGTLGLWLYYRFVVPAAHLDLTEVLVFAATALPLIALLRAALRSQNRQRNGAERVFVLGPLEDVQLVQRKLSNHPEYEMSVVGTVQREACEELGLEFCADVVDLERVIFSGRVDHLIVRLDATYLPQERALELMRSCQREGIRFSCFPAAHGLVPPGVEVNNLEGVGLITSPPPVLPRSSRSLKRVLDVVVSAAMLIALSPLFALIALAIKLDSRGPALFRQRRIGRDGQGFELLKFRTMVEDADLQTAELMARSSDPNWLFLDEDPRITRVGRVLRQTSLDELPQLWNVLRGRMSLVGPRPLSERDDSRVRDWRRNRLDLTPGITGYWQVLGRTSIPFDEMLEVDYAYVAGWSLWHDIQLLLRTFPVVLRRRGVN